MRRAMQYRPVGGGCAWKRTKGKGQLLGPCVCTVWWDSQNSNKVRQVDFTFLPLRQHETVTDLILAAGGCQVVHLRRRSGRCRTETNDTYQIPTHSLSVNLLPLPWGAEAGRTDCVRLWRWRWRWHASVWLYSGRPISTLHICGEGLSEGVGGGEITLNGSLSSQAEVIIALHTLARMQRSI